MSNTNFSNQTEGTGNEKPQTSFWEIQSAQGVEQVEVWKLPDRIKQLLDSEPDFLGQGRLRKSGTFEWMSVRNAMGALAADDAAGLGSLIGTIIFGLFALPIYFAEIGGMSVGWAILAGIGITILMVIFVATNSKGCGGFGALIVIGILSTGQDLEETLSDLADGDFNIVILTGLARGMAVMAAVLASGWIGAQIARPFGFRRGYKQYEKMKSAVEAFRAGKISRETYEGALIPSSAYVTPTRSVSDTTDTQNSAEETIRKYIHAIERQDEMALDECFVIPQKVKLASKGEWQFELKLLEKIETEIKTEMRIMATIHSKTFEKWGKPLPEPEEKSFAQTFLVRKLRDSRWYIAEVLTDGDGNQQTWKTS